MMVNKNNKRPYSWRARQHKMTQNRQCNTMHHKHRNRVHDEEQGIKQRRRTCKQDNGQRKRTSENTDNNKDHTDLFFVTNQI